MPHLAYEQLSEFRDVWNIPSLYHSSTLERSEIRRYSLQMSLMITLPMICGKEWLTNKHRHYRDCTAWKAFAFPLARLAGH